MVKPVRCHPEPGRRPGEGPYDPREAAWSPPGCRRKCEQWMCSRPQRGRCSPPPLIPVLHVCWLTA